MGRAHLTAIGGGEHRRGRRQDLRAGSAVQAGGAGVSAVASGPVLMTGAVDSAGMVDLSAGSTLSMASGSAGSRVEGRITAAGEFELKVQRTQVRLAQRRAFDRAREITKASLPPPLAGALVKNEQDVQLLERLAFMSRRASR